MKYAFLSADWFDQVARLREKAGDLDLPQTIKDIKLNIEVTDGPEGTVLAHVESGAFASGAIGGASAKLTLGYAVASKLFIERDQQAGMQAFMSGQIQVEGDMGTLMSMQSAGGPSEAQKKLEVEIREITE